MIIKNSCCVHRISQVAILSAVLTTGMSGQGQAGAWIRSTKTVAQISIGLRSEDKNFLIELSCLRMGSGRLYSSIALEGPSTSDFEEKSVIKIDGYSKQAHIGGVDGGWMIGDSFKDGTLQLSNDFISGLEAAATIEIPVRSKKRNSFVVFKPSNGSTIFQYYNKECAKVK